ncbi:MAG: lysine--tRNA ligase [Kiritimatiellae bacterium]|nr:lysine--tRNA ligase [Kiritimatiellia bacterium]
MAETEANEYREQRLANLKSLEALGYQPFGKAFERTAPLAEIREAPEEGREVSLAGRLIRCRDMGKSMFADIHDGSDRFQIYVQKNGIGEEAFEAFKLVDVGDHIGVKGALFTTRTGELTVKVASWDMLGKSLLPLPEKFHGLQDVDTRYRQRYLDLVSNPDVRDLFNKRIRCIHEIRNYLVERGFSEVETPMMQSQAGGAAAKPFVTHYSALNTEMFLRIAPELYLKRLLVGGFEKVFELNRNFRNEGLDRTHNPEFTMLEIYQAYTDVSGMKELIEGLITHVCETVFGSLKVGTEAEPIDLSLPWREVTYKELICERMGEDWYTLDLAQAQSRAEAEGLQLDPAWDMLMVTHEVYEKLIEKTLRQPTFVRRFPAPLVPLAKTCEDDPSVVDVFELVIAGQEIAPAYSEMNNPLLQRERFEEQVGEDAERVDDDFLTALEHGMPPAGGMGVGIDRLMMILTGSEAIRDVILFPQLKPRG